MCKTHFHTIAFSPALYLALPFMQINCTPLVFGGVGMRTSIFCASSDGLKFDFTTTFTSILLRDVSRTSGITRNGSWMSFVVRYLKQSQRVRRRDTGHGERAFPTKDYGISSECYVEARAQG